MTHLKKLQEILSDYESIGYDDYNEGRKYLSELVKSHDYKKPDIEIKNIIIEELNMFITDIKEKQSKEFLWLPETSHKYGYWYILQWIVGRWFMDTKNIEKTPNWYQFICKYTPTTKGKDILEVAQTIRDIASLNL